MKIGDAFSPPDSLIDDLDARTVMPEVRVWHEWSDNTWAWIIAAIHFGVFGLGYVFRMWVAG